MGVACGEYWQLFSRKKALALRHIVLEGFIYSTSIFLALVIEVIISVSISVIYFEVTMRQISGGLLNMDNLPTP